MKRSIIYTIQNVDHNKSVKMFLKSKGYSSAVLTMLKKADDGITINGLQVYVTHLLKCGDELIINMTDDDITNAQAEEFSVPILYEDEDIIIYNKPAGMAVHPTKKIQSGTLLNAHLYHIGCAENCVYRPVFRLDRGTSGAVLIAKNKLSSCILAQKVYKEYVCICEGEIDVQGQFDGCIGMCNNSILKREVRQDGQKAHTEFYRISANKEYSVARVVISTGRTHQIRVHLSNAGHALAGDFLYGNEHPELTRHALHCSKLCFIHPITREHIEIDCPIAEDMVSFAHNHGLYL